MGERRKRKSVRMRIDSFRASERALKMGERLTPEQVASLIERSPGQPLPSKLRAYVVGLLRGQSRLPRGAGRKNDGFLWDFTVADAKHLYADALARYRAEHKRNRKLTRTAGHVLPRAEITAHERAATLVLKIMGDELGIHDPKTLRNVLSMPLRCEVSPADEIPPDQHDAPDRPLSEKARRRIIPFR